jgi:hypothetical protein
VFRKAYGRGGGQGGAKENPRDGPHETSIEYRRGWL